MKNYSTGDGPVEEPAAESSWRPAVFPNIRTCELVSIIGQNQQLNQFEIEHISNQLTIQTILMYY